MPWADGWKSCIEERFHTQELEVEIIQAQENGFLKVAEIYRQRGGPNCVDTKPVPELGIAWNVIQQLHSDTYYQILAQTIFRCKQKIPIDLLKEGGAFYGMMNMGLDTQFSLFEYSDWIICKCDHMLEHI